MRGRCPPIEVDVVVPRPVANWFIRATDDNCEFVEDPFELPYSCEGRVCPNDASELLLVKPGEERRIR